MSASTQHSCSCTAWQPTEHTTAPLVKSQPPITVKQLRSCQYIEIHLFKQKPFLILNILLWKYNHQDKPIVNNVDEKGLRKSHNSSYIIDTNGTVPPAPISGISATVTFIIRM